MKTKNLFDHDHILKSRSGIALCIHSKDSVCTIAITEEQFNELVQTLELKEIEQFTHKENRAYLIK